jgi:hypothetical protein
MQSVPSAYYLVVDLAGGGLVGVLASSDVDAALSGSR